MESLKEKTAKGLFWGGLSNGIQQRLNLVFGIFLGRLLSPSEYGMVGMLTIFSLIAGSIQESRDPYAYFLGDDLFVCPVIEKGKTWRRVHLPAGKWIGLWDGKTHYGPLSFTAQAPLGRLPVFYREGSAFTEAFRAAAAVGDVPQSRKKR